jgi:hypothetical protein
MVCQPFHTRHISVAGTHSLSLHESLTAYRRPQLICAELSQRGAFKQHTARAAGTPAAAAAHVPAATGTMEQHLVHHIQNSLALGLHDNARFLAERLVAAAPAEVAA